MTTGAHETMRTSQPTRRRRDPTHETPRSPRAPRKDGAHPQASARRCANRTWPTRRAGHFGARVADDPDADDGHVDCVPLDLRHATDRPLRAPALPEDAVDARDHLG